jgi:hypothetical protein
VQRFLQLLLILLLSISFLLILNTAHTNTLAKSTFWPGTRGINVITNLILWADRSPDAYSLGEARRLKQLGVEFIRLPVDPLGLMDSVGVLVPAQLNGLDTAIRNFNSAGLRVIVDMHSFGNFPGSNRDFTQQVVCGGAPLETYKRFVTQLAKHLNQFDQRRVAFEILNEPYNPKYKDAPCLVAGKPQEDIHWVKTLEQLRQAARAGAPEITLVISGEDWGSTQSLQALPRLKDPNIIYSVHYYEKLEFTHQGADWINDDYKGLEQVPYPLQVRSLNQIWPKIAANIDSHSKIQDKTTAKQTTRKKLECYYGMPKSGCQPYGRQDIVKTFAEAVHQAKRLGVPPRQLLLGEFGVLSRFLDSATDQPHTAALIPDKVAWLTDVRRSAESVGMAHALWNYTPVNGGGGFSVFKPDNSKQPDNRILRAIGLRVIRQGG